MLINTITPNIKTRTIFDYDFTETNPSSDLLGYQNEYGYTQIQGSGLRTYNVSSGDKGGRCGKQIGEDLAGKKITMEGTRYAAFGQTWCWLGLGIAQDLQLSGPAQVSSTGISTTLYTTYYSGYTTYDNLLCPGITNGTGKSVSAYGRTIGTSGSYEIKFNRILDLKGGTSTLLVYKDGTLHSTQEYTLTSSEISLVNGYVGSNYYYLAQFGRGYSDVDMYFKNRKIIVED